MDTILEQSPLFRGLEKEHIAELLNKYTYSVIEFKKGEVIAKKDTAYSSLMIVLRGIVRGETTNSGGIIMRSNEIKAPNLISPAFLFGGYNRLPINVVAQSDVSILMLHRASLFGMMQEDPVILSNFIDILSQRANLLTKKLFYLSFRSLKSQIAEYLINKTYNLHEPTCEKDLVKYFEVTMNSVERVLEDFTKVNAIQVEDTRIIVSDVEKLKSILNDNK